MLIHTSKHEFLPSTNSEARLSVCSGWVFGSTVWVGLCSQCCVAAASHMYSTAAVTSTCVVQQIGELMCRAAQGGGGAGGGVFYTCLSWLVGKTDPQQVQGTSLELRQATKETGRKGIGQAVPWRKHPSFQFQKTQTALQFLQQPTLKLT